MNKKLMLAIAAATFASSTWAVTPVVKGDPIKGKITAQAVCAACHGADGNSVAAANPTLAGQSEHYLYKQLMDFKAGVRKNPIMLGMASSLSEDDMRNVAAYFASQKLKPRQAADKTKMDLGKQIYRSGLASTKVPACMSCHGPSGKGLPDKYPALSSQHAPYVLTQLNAYKIGTDRNNAVMHDISKRLSDEEMKSVAEYISGLY